MSNLQLTWSEAELLANDDVAEPLVAAGLRCHGGFADDGRYVSPRTKNRVPATKAWQQSHREQFGRDILDAPLELWPDVFPSVAQTKYLLRAGVPGPTISAVLLGRKLPLYGHGYGFALTYVSAITPTPLVPGL